MDEGLGSHVEQFAREFDNEDQFMKGSYEGGDSDDESEEGEGEKERDV